MKENTYNETFKPVEETSDRRAYQTMQGFRNVSDLLEAINKNMCTLIRQNNEILNKLDSIDQNTFHCS